MKENVLEEEEDTVVEDTVVEESVHKEQGRVVGGDRTALLNRAERVGPYSRATLLNPVTS